MVRSNNVMVIGALALMAMVCRGGVAEAAPAKAIFDSARNLGPSKVDAP